MRVFGKLRRIRNTLAAARESLFQITPEPEVWDEATTEFVELQRRPEVRRVNYPQYLFGLLSAARTARAIGAREFTAIEFGVAGGNGLVAMEQHAATVEQIRDLKIHIVGFDTSFGLPSLTDPRDCPFGFSGGEFRMDEAKLRARLDRAELRLGDVSETARAYALEEFPPIGFVSNDLDLYSSTRDSFALFAGDTSKLLPRVTMYFDDLHGYPYTTASGEWAAIDEFNATHRDRRFGQIVGLKYCLGRRFRFATWVESFFVLHAFDHPGYNALESKGTVDLSLRG